MKSTMALGKSDWIVLGIIFGGMIATVVAILILLPNKSYGYAAEVTFSESQCSMLAHASDYIQATKEVGADKGLVLERIQNRLAANGWSVPAIQRFIWELNVMWGRRIDPRSVETSCLERGGKYGEGEVVRYEDSVRS